MSWSRSSNSCFVSDLRRGTSWRWRDWAATAPHDEPRSGGPSAWRRSSQSAATMTASQHLYTSRTGAHWYSPPLADLGYRPGDMALLPPARPGFWSGCRRTSAARGGRRVPGTDSDDRRPCADPRVPRGERALRILGTGVGRPTRGGTGRWLTGWLTRPTSVTGRLIPRTPNGPPNSDWPKPCWAGGGRTRRVRIVRERRDSSTAGPPTHHRCRTVRDTDQPVGSQRPPKKVSGPGPLETGRSRPLRGGDWPRSPHICQRRATMNDLATLETSGRMDPARKRSREWDER